MRSLSEEVFVSKLTAMGPEARYVNCILDFAIAGWSSYVEL